MKDFTFKEVVEIPVGVDPQDSKWLNCSDVFVLGPDGKGHPTREEIEKFVFDPTRDDEAGVAVAKLLNRISTVAS